MRGIRRSEDTFSLQMIDATGRFHFIDKMTVADVRVDPVSLMPAYKDRRSATEEVDEPRGLSRGAKRAPDTTKTRGRADPGGISYERLTRRRPGAAQLADVLGQLPGHALLRA